MTQPVVRFILGLPDLTGAPGETSVLREAPSSWRRLAAQGRVFRILPAEPAMTPELAWLGLEPGGRPIPAGPIHLAAFRAVPPDRDVQMAVTLMHLSEAGVTAADPPSPAESREVEAALGRLSSPRLTTVLGEGL
ncbi:MAG: hypothetical protein MH204_05425, partial [Fimbriimonadaceae bacterium]|nr:hypothetical protein [Fimbriimonadaceae bacterium]